MADKKKQEPEQIKYEDIIAVYDELDELKQQHPDIVAEVSKKYAKDSLFDRFLKFYLNMREKYHIEVPVKKKTYCWLCLLGAFGVHHFYSRHWIKGLIYLAICWSGISLGMSFIDWMAAFPKEPDENGMIIV